MRTRPILLVLALVAASSLLAPASPAAAEPHGGKSFHKVSPLKRIGVDHEIAAANGYDVRVDSYGIEYAVKKGTVTTSNEVYGPCGSSWVYFTAVDTTKHYTSIYTGFTILPSFNGAVFAYWDVVVVDSYGSSVKSWRDPATSVYFWAKSRGFTSSGPGSAFAEVVASYAILADGTICFSYEPFDTVML